MFKFTGDSRKGKLKLMQLFSDQLTSWKRAAASYGREPVPDFLYGREPVAGMGVDIHARKIGDELLVPEGLHVENHTPFLLLRVITEPLGSQE